MRTVNRFIVTSLESASHVFQLLRKAILIAAVAGVMGSSCITLPVNLPRALSLEKSTSPQAASAFSDFLISSGLNLVASDNSRTVTQPAVSARKV